MSKLKILPSHCTLNICTEVLLLQAAKKNLRKKNYNVRSVASQRSEYDCSFDGNCITTVSSAVYFD